MFCFVLFVLFQLLNTHKALRQRPSYSVANRECQITCTCLHASLRPQREAHTRRAHPSREAAAVSLVCKFQLSTVHLLHHRDASRLALSNARVPRSRFRAVFRTSLALP